jgi:hypothetical protein
LKVIRIFRKQSKIQSAAAATNLSWRALEGSKDEVVLCNVANGCLANADLFNNLTHTLTSIRLAVLRANQLRDLLDVFFTTG